MILQAPSKITINAVKLGANDAVLFNNRGKAKFNSNDVAGSVADFDKAIQLNPTYGKALLNRGTAKFALKDYAGASDDLEKAKTSEGETPDVLRMLGNCKLLVREKRTST